MGTETSAAVRSRGIYHTPASTITKATSQSSPDRQCSSYDNEAAGFGDTAQNSYSYDASRAIVVGSFIWAGFDYIGEPTPTRLIPDTTSYKGTSRKAFSGRGLAIVRSTGAAGAIVVSASSSGLTSGSVTVSAQ